MGLNFERWACSLCFLTFPEDLGRTPVGNLADSRGTKTALMPDRTGWGGGWNGDLRAQKAGVRKARWGLGSRLCVLGKWSSTDLHPLNSTHVGV